MVLRDTTGAIMPDRDTIRDTGAMVPAGDIGVLASSESIVSAETEAGTTTADTFAEAAVTGTAIMATEVDGEEADTKQVPGPDIPRLHRRTGNRAV